MPEKVKDIKVLLKEMSEAIEEREKVIAEARRIREIAIEAGAANQRWAWKSDIPELQTMLDEVSGSINRIDEIIETFTDEVEQLRELERIGEAFRHFGLPAALTRRSK